MTIDLNQVYVCVSWRYCLLFLSFKNNSIHIFRMKAYIFRCSVMLLFQCFDRLFKVLRLGDCTSFIYLCMANLDDFAHVLFKVLVYCSAPNIAQKRNATEAVMFYLVDVGCGNTA